jgi:hypothetical protein
VVSLNGGSSWILSDSGGPATAFDILSTPEPAASALTGLGLTVLLVLARRRQCGSNHFWRTYSTVSRAATY